MDASKKPKQHKVQLYLFYKNTKSVSRSNKTPFILQKTQRIPAKLKQHKVQLYLFYQNTKKCITQQYLTFNYK